MPFGTRRRIRPAFRFIDPIFKETKSSLQKLKEISNQGLENTSQREDPRPSAKAAINTIVQNDKVEKINRVVKGAQPLISSTIKKAEGFIKKSNQEQSGESKFKKMSVHNPNVALKSLPMENAPQAEFSTPKPTASSHNSSHKSSHNTHKPKSSQDKVLQIITDKVKGNLAKAESKIKSLTAKGLRGQVEKQIKLKELQLSKLRTLLSKCPTCK